MVETSNKRGKGESVSGQSRLSEDTHGNASVAYAGKCVEKKEWLRMEPRERNIVGVNKGRGTSTEQPDVGVKDF